jgi:DNA polymerase-1
MELPLAPLLFRMERAGLKVDRATLADLSNYLGLELKKLTVRIYELAGREFNIGSPKQVGEVLSELEMTSGRKTSTGRISTSKAVLEELAQTFELPRLIIDYRELDKLKSVYTDALPHQIAPDGRIHCLLNQTVAATGRLSSSDPNLQNIPIRSELGRRIRRSFVAEKGNKIISADYSQLELRLLAHITQDPVMLEAFQKGEDIHARTARLVFGAKTDEELKEARRFAKLLVSEIKLYNEKAVVDGRQHGNLYERLKEDIDRSRQMYDERIPEDVRASSNFFYEELVRILADGRAEALGI